MQHFSGSPKKLIGSLWRNRVLIYSLVERDVLGRYRGSAMGILWAFFHPIMLLTIYTLVFSAVFKAKWNPASDSKVEFALVLFAGLLIFNIFAECVNKAPGLILANVSYVKRVVFPLEILPWVLVGSSIFHAAVGLLIWLFAYVLLAGVPHLTIFWFPLVLIPIVLFVVGLSWVLASLGVFLRDISQFVGVLTTTLLFLSPVFYPATALPEEYRFLIFINPLTPAIELARDVLYWGKNPNWTLFTISTTVAAFVAITGFAWFQKTRKGFADVL